MHQLAFAAGAANREWGVRLGCNTTRGIAGSIANVFGFARMAGRGRRVAGIGDLVRHEQAPGNLEITALVWRHKAEIADLDEPPRQDVLQKPREEIIQPQAAAVQQPQADLVNLGRHLVENAPDLLTSQDNGKLL